MTVIGVLIAIVLAALVYALCVALGLGREQGPCPSVPASTVRCTWRLSVKAFCDSYHDLLDCVEAKVKPTVVVR